MKTDDGTAINVVPAAEVEAKLSAVKTEQEKLTQKVSELMQQIQSDNAATGVALDQRKDDIAKYARQVEELLAEVGKLKELKHQKQVGQMSASMGELRDSLVSLSGGFWEGHPTDPEKDNIEKPAGSKLHARHLIEGVQLPTGEWWTAKNQRVRELQTLSDRCVLLHAVLSNGSRRDQYQAAGGVKSLKTYKALQALWKDTAEQLTSGPADTNLMDSTEMANWIPTMQSGQLFELIKIGLPEISLFREITMPSATYELPVLAGERESMKVTAPTTIPQASPFADNVTEIFTPLKVTLTAGKLRARMLINNDTEEDMIIPALPLMESDLIRQHQEAMADWFVNGQLVGAALDLRNNVDGHFGKLSGAGQTAWDARGMSRGLRKLSVDNTATPDTHVSGGGVALTLTAMNSARIALREHGVDPTRLVYILSITAFLRLLRAGDVATRDKFGDLATVFTGVLAAVDGSPLIVSRRFPLNLDATGVIPAAGGGTLTGVSVVHRDAMIVGNRRRMTAGRDTYGATDVTDVFSFWRGDFKPLYADSVPYVGDIYNVAN